MRRLARSGDGVYATLAADDIDINSIAYLFESSIDEREARLSDQSADLWRELGPWLILLCLPLAALAFRRGFIWMLPLGLLLPPRPTRWTGSRCGATTISARCDCSNRVSTPRPPNCSQRGLARGFEISGRRFAAALETWQSQDHDRMPCTTAATRSRVWGATTKRSRAYDAAEAQSGSRRCAT